jgi:predicted ATPase/DNA-binding SARP family transcriptional activator
MGVTVATTTVGVLGPVTAWVGDEEVVGPPRQRAVLAVLALAEGGVVSRDVIVAALWGDEPPASADHAVQVYVSGLRRMLGAEAVETVAPGYRLAAHVGVDVATHARLVDEARQADGLGDLQRSLALLRDAVALWRGDPLAGHEDAPFALTEVSRLHELRITTRELHLAAEVAAGNHRAVIGALEALVVDAPGREEPQHLLLVALHRAGRGEEALARYDGWRRRLADEFGLDPSPSMQRLHQRLLDRDATLGGLRGDVGAATLQARRTLERVVRLPVERTPLVGREDEIDALLARVATPGLTTLVGPGGVGKTRLALAVARRAAEEQIDEHAHGVVFVDLADETDLEAVPAATAAALGLSGADASGGWAPYASALAQRACLVVLDNLEHLDGAGKLVGQLLDLAPACTVLATSRIRLRTAGEQVATVAPLRTDGPRSTASELFRRRAAAVDPAVQLADDEVAALVARLDGMPLAIELAAGRVGLLSPGELLRTFEQFGSGALADGPVDAPERHRSLERSLRWSVGLIDEVDQVLLRRLGVFDGAFTIDSARAVAGGDRVADVFAGLARLFDAHLLQRTVGAGPARFRMLVPVREFARAELGRSTEAADVRARHTAHHLDLARQLGPRLTGGTRRAALDAFDHARADIDEALRCSDPVAGLEAAAAMWRAWQIRGRTRHGRALVDELLRAATPSAATATLLRGRLVAAHLRYFQGEPAVAHAEYQAVADAARGVDDEVTVEALGGVATTSGYIGLDPEALPAILDELVPLAEAAGTARQLSEARAMVAVHALKTGRLADARRGMDDARSLAVESGDLWWAARMDAGAARVALASGDAEGALRLALRGLDFAVDVGELPLVVHGLDWCGAALAELGHHEIGVEVEAAADALRQRIGAGLRLNDRGVASTSQRVAEHLDEETRATARARGTLRDHAAAVAVVRAACDRLGLRGGL